jgi:hypothetical protein
MSRTLCIVGAFAFITLQIGCGSTSTARAGDGKREAGDGRREAAVDSRVAAYDTRSAAVSYSGTDSRGVPHYFSGRLGDEERRLLRDAFGVVSASNLYISDSTKDGLVKYDPRQKPCSYCYVNSYRIGFVSIRKKGETWDELEHRVRALTRNSFPAGSLVTSSSLSTMDPDVQEEVGQMLEAARRAGFQLHVVTTYRSPEQEALLMANGGGRTHTLTSLHSYGRAIDVRIGDGNVNNPSTRRSWIDFRRWVTRFRGDDFRVLGAPDRSWDWPHVELPSGRIGFRSVDAAIAAARICLASSSPHACEFSPHLPASGISGTKQ